MFLAKLMLHMYQTLKMLRKKENEEIHPYIYMYFTGPPTMCKRLSRLSVKAAAKTIKFFKRHKGN